MTATLPEVSWFGALCDDDYEQLGVADPALASSWEHCRAIVSAADRNGYDAVLLPSGYALGIDATAFAAAIGPLTERVRLLLAVRVGELVVPQLARQVATVERHTRSLRLVLDDAVVVELGDGTRLKAKSDAALALLDQADRATIATIDVSVPGTAALTRSEAAGA